VTRQLVNPRSLPRITSNFFPHNVAIQTASSAQGPGGQPDPTWSTLPGLSAVPCRIAPISAVQERKLREQVTSEADSVVLIVGRYADVLTTSGRLVDSRGRAYDVLGVEEDSVGSTTRVICRRTTT
jgi:hypothetical protein